MLHDRETGLDGQHQRPTPVSTSTAAEAKEQARASESQETPAASGVVKQLQCTAAKHIESGLGSGTGLADLQQHRGPFHARPGLKRPTAHAPSTSPTCPSR